MSTVIDSARPARAGHRTGRIIERTTTITREIYVDYPEFPAPPPTANSDEPDDHTANSLGGVNRLAVRLGFALAIWGRRHATRRPAVGGAEIARRLQARKDHDFRYLGSLPR